jgi:hypothetical protein
VEAKLNATFAGIQENHPIILLNSPHYLPQKAYLATPMSALLYMNLVLVDVAKKK